MAHTVSVNHRWTPQTFWLSPALGSLLRVLCSDHMAQHNQASVRKGNYLGNDWQHTLASPDSSIKSDMALLVVGQLSSFLHVKFCTWSTETRLHNIFIQSHGEDRKASLTGRWVRWWVVSAVNPVANSLHNSKMKRKAEGNWDLFQWWNWLCVLDRAAVF